MIVLLPARHTDSLDWNLSNVAADPLFWELDLGLQDAGVSYNDPLILSAQCLALKRFTSDVWPTYSSQTKGVILYRGAPPSDIEALASYIPLLAPHLPDEVPLYLLFQTSGVSSARLAHLFARERFEHVRVALEPDAPEGIALYAWEGEEVRPSSRNLTRGLVFPSLDQCSEEILLKLDQTLREQGPLRIVWEPFLAEEWEGLEELFAWRGSLSSRGIRALRGFELAGGRVLWLEDLVSHQGRGFQSFPSFV